MIEGAAAFIWEWGQRRFGWRRRRYASGQHSCLSEQRRFGSLVILEWVCPGEGEEYWNGVGTAIKRCDSRVGSDEYWGLERRGGSERHRRCGGVSVDWEMSVGSVGKVGMEEW